MLEGFIINYYEQHIGDYIKNTAHLSMVEDGAYRRLIDAYYTREGALPADIKVCCKLARAQSKPEREAVEYVLGEFFALCEDGYHQSRCDEELEKYKNSEPEREAKKANERERQQRARDRRRELFEVLRGHGEVPPFDAPMSELQRLVNTVDERVKSRTRHAPVTRDVTCDNTATQSPLPTSQYPIQDQNPLSSTASTTDRGEQPVPDQPDPKPRFSAKAMPTPAEVDRAAWVEWCEYRSGRRKPISERAAVEQLQLLATFPADVQRLMVKESIKNDYQGLFKLKTSTPQQPQMRRSFGDVDYRAGVTDDGRF